MKFLFLVAVLMAICYASAALPVAAQANFAGGSYGRELGRGKQVPVICDSCFVGSDVNGRDPARRVQYSGRDRADSAGRYRGLCFFTVSFRVRPFNGQRRFTLDHR